MREETLKKDENSLTFIWGAGGKTLKQGRYVLGFLPSFLLQPLPAPTPPKVTIPAPSQPSEHSALVSFPSTLLCGQSWDPMPGS